ncbi:MAG: GNAT family N-acetyltransferase [Bacillota bacterium]
MYFSGELVNLRVIKESDLKACVEYLNDLEIKLNLDDDPPMPMNEDMEKEWYKEYIKRKDIYKGFNLAIETKDGKFIGTCGANSVYQKNKVATVGIFIGHRDYLGKGYGTEAMKLLVDFMFKEININKISLHVFSFNQRAVKSYEKCGFKIEAVGREAIFRFGKYHDEYTMSILREEYFENGDN